MNRPANSLLRPDRQIRLMLISQGIWIALLFGFFTWWGHLLGTQAQRIAELELATGIAPEQVSNSLDKLNRIVFWG